MSDHILAVDRLSAGYGKLVVLHDVSLAIEPERFYAILGPNGSGKSTLVKSVFGLTQLFDGDILFDGHSVAGMNTERISRLGLAYVPQRENIFASMTVRENLQLAVRGLVRAEGERALVDAYALFPILCWIKCIHFLIFSELFSLMVMMPPPGLIGFVNSEGNCLNSSLFLNL